LTLAKALAEAPLDRALRKLADAFTPTADLPREVYAAWTKSRREKTASLALSWARGPVRRSLEETIAGGRRCPAQARADSRARAEGAPASRAPARPPGVPPARGVRGDRPRAAPGG